MGEPLRIALMLESDGPGGAEVMLLQLAEALRRRGHEVLPVGPERGSGWLAAQFRGRGFEPATFSLRRPIDWRCLRGLICLLGSRGIQVVHSHEFTMAVYGAAAARRVGARHVITMHGGTYFADEWRRRVALRWAAARSAALVGVSAATASQLCAALGLPAERVAVVPNGIEHRPGAREPVRRELGLAETDVHLVAVGNLYAVKGHAVLLRALGALRREGVSEGVSGRWCLSIAGRGDEEGPLRALAAAEGIADRVRLLGYREDVANVLAAADLFVMPSLSEGLPLALVEAMSAALPIVASEVGGIPEAVTHGHEALLVPPGDVAALAGVLRTLLRDPAGRRQLGEAAQVRALRDFSVSAMADRYERLYRGSPRARAASADPAPLHSAAAT